MSTKASIFLTRDNEHWYYDFIDDSITLEINRHNIQGDYSDSQHLVLEIKRGCDLWKHLKEFRSHNFECGRKELK